MGQKINSLQHAKKPVPSKEEVTCNKCRKFSGWTNDDLRQAHGNLYLNCKECGKPCIKVMAKPRSSNFIQQDHFIKREDEDIKL